MSRLPRAAAEVKSAADLEQLEQMDLETALVLDEFEDEDTRRQLAEAYHSHGRWEPMRQAQQIRDAAAPLFAVDAERQRCVDRGFIIIQEGDNMLSPSTI